MKFLWNYIKSRMPLLLLAFCIITCAVASMVYAKYVDDNKGNASVDIITGGKLTVDISEPAVSGNEYTYSIKNTDESNITVYVRAAIVVNWQDSEGNLWAISPKEGTDYTINAKTCTKLGDYYYYKGTCNPDRGFPISVTLTGTPPSGYTLHVKILAEGIQSMPENAVGEAWGYTYTSEGWVKYPTN